MAGEIVVLVTTASEAEAKAIATRIVQDRLVACVNIVPAIQSVFEWEGQVSEEQESLLIIKTTVEMFAMLESAVKMHHSYRVPEIIAFPIQMGSADYLDWLRHAVNPTIANE
ncbi:MAG: divalent-cation tolerance protein CutA [Nitrospirales bacterium]|nr:MAG: divalent-cation tolerance protein CutA [Nitrospirales bacterium]